jgi:uncharacterized protein (DUF433 family)
MTLGLPAKNQRVPSPRGSAAARGILELRGGIAMPIVEQARATHIQLDETGTPWIADANTSVMEVVLDRLAYGWSPEEIHYQHPHLSLAQIHAALSWYYDHQSAMDAEIERDSQEITRLRASAGESPFVKRMRSEGRVR